MEILRINKKFTFEFDDLSVLKIKQFKIETDKKNEIVFKKIQSTNKFEATDTLENVNTQINGGNY